MGMVEHVTEKHRGACNPTNIPCSGVMQSSIYIKGGSFGSSQKTASLIHDVTLVALIQPKVMSVSVVYSSYLT